MNEKGEAVASALKFLAEHSEETKKLSYEYSKLCNEEIIEYTKLLDDLKIRNTNTSIQGKKLERIVNYLIDKSYYYKVKHNVKTSTNEIDQLITLSEKGLNYYNDMGFIPCKENSKDKIIKHLNLPKVFLGECKNYGKKLGVTYIGKVYSVMTTLDINLAIIFTIKGFTGTYGNWNDGVGLCKTIRLIEKYKNNREYFYIIDFNLSDFEKISKGYNFFEIIEQKICCLQEGVNYNLSCDLDERKGVFVSEAKTIIKQY